MLDLSVNHKKNTLFADIKTMQ